MAICIIFNANAGSAEQIAGLREALQGRSGITVQEPATSQEATAMAARALQAGYDPIVAAGGDGTVNAVLNGLAADFGRARFGIIPLGTGNDLRRTLAIPDDPLAALALLSTGESRPARPMDLIRVESAGRTIYCGNVASGGFAGQLQESVTQDIKDVWGPLTYLRAMVNVLPDLQDYHTRIRLDDGPVEELSVFNLIVANGRTAAGGFQVAGRANPEDGLLDVIIVLTAAVLDLTDVAAQLLTGDYLDSDHVVFRRARRIYVDATPGMTFSIDGDVFTSDPATFTVVPHALRVVVGPDYVAEVGEPMVA